MGTGDFRCRGLSATLFSAPRIPSDKVSGRTDGSGAPKSETVEGVAANPIYPLTAVHHSPTDAHVRTHPQDLGETLNAPDRKT
jgi:hypothetical protein